MSQAYRERVACFGSSRGLVGVLTLPAGEPVADAPQVIFLNAGILHRVGTSRIHVALARHLAEYGIASLRFDLSAIGDSDRRAEVSSLRESVRQDISEAVDHLAALDPLRGVVLIGVCSGAYDAVQAALVDERVVGAVLIDIPGPFQTWRHAAHHFGSRVFRLASWRRPLQKAAYYSRSMFRPRAGARGAGEDYVVGGRSSTPRQLMATQFATLLDRGVRLLVIFTPGVERNYNHRSLFRSTFPRAAAHPLLAFDYFEDADHALSRLADRVRLLHTVGDWARGAGFRKPGASDPASLEHCELD